MLPNCFLKGMHQFTLSSAVSEHSSFPQSWQQSCSIICPSLFPHWVDELRVCGTFNFIWSDWRILFSRFFPQTLWHHSMKYCAGIKKEKHECHKVSWKTFWNSIQKKRETSRFWLVHVCFQPHAIWETSVYTQPCFMPKTFLQHSLFPRVIQIYFSKNTACCPTTSSYLQSSEKMDQRRDL